MKKIISLLLAILIITTGIGVFAETNNTAEITVIASNGAEPVSITKLTDEEVQAILSDPNTVTETITINTRASGFTSVNISTSKNGSTATVVISSNASGVCSQIGFKDGYIQNAGTLGSDYKTSTSTYSAGYSFTMTSGVSYYAYAVHHCKLSSGGEYTYPQTSATISK